MVMKLSAQTLMAVFVHPDDEITTVIDVSDYAEAKLSGIRCHATQVDPHSPFAETPDEVTRQPWFRSEMFQVSFWPARLSAGPARRRESCLPG